MEGGGIQGEREEEERDGERERGHTRVLVTSFLLLLKKLHLFLSLMAKATLFSHCSEWETCPQSATAIQQKLSVETHESPTR